MLRSASLLITLAIVAAACASDDPSAQQRDGGESAGGAGGAGGASVSGHGGDGGSGESSTTSHTGGAGGEGGGVGGGAGGAGGAGGSPFVPVETPWCTDGWLGLDERTCFVAPDDAQPASVVIFLHGMLPPTSSPKTMQAIMRQAAQAHGFVALFPQGRPGQCSWDPSVLDWLCFPTSQAAVDADGPAFFDEWEQAQVKLESALGTTFTRRYVIGFSNGGYFASHIGLEGVFPVDGAGVVAAGQKYIVTIGDARPRFYVAAGADDAASVRDSAANLAYFLQQKGWPREYVVHPGRGHEIRADDLDAAWATWNPP